MAKGKPKYNKVLNEIVLGIVGNQLRDGEPPEARQTYERLIKAGYSDKETRDLIGCAACTEIYDIMKYKRPFDNDRYVAMLKRLPTLPWE